MHEPLSGKTRGELESLAKQRGWPVFRGRQLAEWLYKRHAMDFDAMSSLSKTARSELAADYSIGRCEALDARTSSDGTIKYLFPAGEGQCVETVMIPDGERVTLCISTQIGCRRGCRFCVTGKQGFQGNLSAAEILNQYTSVPERDMVTNIVIMGMGEPLDNANEIFRALDIFTSDYGYAMSPSRLTLSTVGILPALKVYLDLYRCHLALSVHSPFEDERFDMMPVQRKYPLSAIIDLLRRYDWRGQRRLTLEYILFRGVNDSRAHARELARLFRGIRCRVNLIPFHGGTGLPYEPCDRSQMEQFQRHVKAEGFMTVIRKSRGCDIGAACGQLTTREKVRSAGERQHVKY